MSQMNPPLELPGLQRLVEVCGRLKLSLEMTPPAHVPLKAGALVEGLPFDPLLASVYAYAGFAAFATDVAGIILHPLEDADRQLEDQNKRWVQRYREQLALPTFIFAGEPHMAYHYATVPTLADNRGYQTVVRVDVYEEPFALPVASNVDHFFDAYSRYLEELIALPEGRERGVGLLTFPWDVPHLLGRDGRLVELIHRGHLDPLMPGAEARGWARRIVSAGKTRV
ncbi:MAG TPA: hypothetical protein VF815_15560 [Myxococcaceae bacterium]|jgi:hypothetical protein